MDSFDKMYYYAEKFIAQRNNELERNNEVLETAEGTDRNEKVGFLRFFLSNKNLSKEDVLAIVADLLFADVDTTSNTAQWALYMMGKYSKKQEELHQEVTSVLGRHQHPSAETLSKMPYLKAWVKETLRLYPVVFALPRMLTEDLILSGYRVPAGTEIDIAYYAMGRNEKLFDDPNCFKPERWLRNERNRMQDIPDPFASLPFGFGKRMCIGRRLAELELYLILSRIIQEFRIGYPENEVVEPALLGLVKPDRPVRVQFQDRNQ